MVYSVKKIILPKKSTTQNLPFFGHLWKNCRTRILHPSPIKTLHKGDDRQQRDISTNKLNLPRGPFSEMGHDTNFHYIYDPVQLYYLFFSQLYFNCIAKTNHM